MDWLLFIHDTFRKTYDKYVICSIKTYFMTLCPFDTRWFNSGQFELNTEAISDTN